MKLKSRKIIFSILAVIALALTGVAAALIGAHTQYAEAADNVVSVNIDGNITYHTSFEEGWNKAATATSSESNRVEVLLLADIVADSATHSFGTGTGFTVSDKAKGCVFVPEYRYITLDLNGKNLDRGLTTSTDFGYVINIKGNLILTDTSADGVGKVCGGNNSNTPGGGVYVNGKFTMSGGTIEGNNTTQGGGVFVSSSGTFTMTGGTISGNTANYGGGVYVYGDYNTAGTFTMNGGKITGNTSTNYGGGVCLSSNKVAFNLGGSAKITGNTAGAEGAKKTDNVYLPKNKTINITDAFTGEVGVTCATAPTADNPSVTLTSGWDTSSSTGTITADNDSYLVVNSGSELALKAAVVQVNEQKYTTFAEGWNAAVAADSSESSSVEVKLLADIVADSATHSFGTGTGFGSNGYVIVPDKKYITLDLNGHKLDRGLTAVKTNGFIIKVSGNFILTDNSADKNGVITGGNTFKGGGVYVEVGTFTMSGGEISRNTAADYGGGVYVSGSGTFTMTGGTINGNTSTNYGGGGVYVNSSGTFTMSGGKIIGNTSTMNGGGVYVNGTFNLSGGEITGNTAKYGGGIFQNGTFNLSGSATVKDNTAGAEAAKELNNVHINGNTINITDTFTGKVGVSKIGLVAEGYTQADAPSAHFVPDNPDYKCVSAKNGNVMIAAEHKQEADDNDCTTPTLCSACGTQVAAAPNGNHSFGDYTSDGASGHSRSCQNSGCNAKENGAHVPQEDDGNCLTALTCTVCSYVIKAAETTHEYGSYTDDGNGNHTATCTHTGCNKTDTQPHEAGEWQCSQDNTQHYHICTVCGAEFDSDIHRGGTATCTDKKVCTTCHKTYGNTIPHTYNQEVASETYLKSAATCTAKAVYYYSCVCGAKGTETFESGDFAPHTEVVDEAVTATCKTEGKTEGKHCSVCNTVIVEQQTVAKLPHTEVVDQAVTATCTTEGKTQGKHCSVCNTVIVEQQTVEKLPHTDAIDEAVTATCTTEGKTQGKHCSVCNTVIVEQETVAKLPHTEVVDQAVTATCTTEGKTQGKHCSVCNTVIVAQETVAKLPHTEVVDQAVAPTCTTEGKTQGKHCSVCNTVIVTQETVAKLPHTEVVDQAVGATCTTEGKTEGKHCSVCNTVLVAQQMVAKLPHTEGNWKVDKAATATEAGSKHKACTVCGATTATEEIPATGTVTPEPEEVTITVVGGTIDGEQASEPVVGETTVTVNKDGTVTVVAQEVEGKTFKGWSADGGKTILNDQMRYTFSAKGNIRLMAVYAEAIPVQPEKGLSGGAIAGITIGCVIAVLAAVYVVGLILYKKDIIGWKICRVLYFYIAK